MTDLRDMANKPVTIELGGRELQAKRPSLGELFAELERQAEQEELARIRMMADLEGLTDAKRARFIHDCLADVPRGQKLQELAWEKFGTPAGITLVLSKALAKTHPELSDDVQLLVESDLEAATAWATYLCGLEKKAPVMASQESQPQTPPSTGATNTVSSVPSTDGDQNG